MDRRQRRTRRAIYAAFEQLLLEQHYRDITVAQIIERADIGRSTFYTHFDTKDELLNQVCEELFVHVFDGMEVDAHTHPSSTGSALEQTLAHLLHHLRESHGGICGKLLAEGEIHFTSRFCELLSAYLGPQLPERSSWVPRDLMSSLVVSAFCKAISWWYEHDYEVTPEQLTHWYMRTLGWEVQAPR